MNAGELLKVKKNDKIQKLYDGFYSLTTCNLTVRNPDDSPGDCETFGFVNQMDMFVDTLTVGEQLRYVASLRFKGWSNARRNERIGRVLNQFRLKDVENNQMGNAISGGERRRLSFACASIHEPSELSFFSDNSIKFLINFLFFNFKRLVNG